MRVQRQATYVRVEAPAKLNLFLEVLGKRSDGFHDIETLMVPINLFDSLTFTPHPCEPSQTGAVDSFAAPPSRGLVVDQIALDCRWAGSDVRANCLGTSSLGTNSLGTLPPPAENLATRAAVLLRRRAGVTAGATIQLLKRIPSAAGLGGGSSDAAATLLAGNAAWRIDWPPERLVELAAELGSDVPFFLGEGAAICRGRGERIERLPQTGSLHAVVARPPEGLATAEIYAHCTPSRPPRNVAPLVSALGRGDLKQLGRLIYNRLEEPATELSRWIGRLRREFARLGCLGSQMSGSGTSYFGICHHAVHARHVAGRCAQEALGTSTQCGCRSSKFDWLRRFAVEITEVRIKLIEDGGERLHAFCSITLDDSFVVRDLKIIEGSHGPFVAMPSRKLTSHCPQCGMKNHLRSAYCNQCGTRQKDERPARDEEGRTKLYADIAHPINSACREMIQQRVIHEYQNELKRAKLPGYVSRYDDIDGEAVPPVPHAAIAGTTASHVSAGHPATSHAPAPHAVPSHAAPPHIAPSHTGVSHVPASHTPAAHAPKPPSAMSAPLEQPRIQSAEDPRSGLHRPGANGRSGSPSGPQQDGFGAGIFES